MNIERLSLDQLRVFSQVAELGSFSAAARKLHRAQSAVSQAIAALEAQLALVLFDRSTYRPQPTCHARMLLPQVRDLLERADRLEDQAQMLSGGVEPQVGLVVDGAFPMRRIAEALRQFGERYPAVGLKLHSDSMSDLVTRLAAGNADIGIVATLPTLPPGFDAFALEPVSLAPVAAPGYALAQQAGVLDAPALRDAVQIVVSEKDPAPSSPDYSVSSTRTWRVADFAAKRELLLAGLGWGAMPMHLIEQDLRDGRLQLLRTTAWPSMGEVLPAFCLHASTRKLGPAAQMLLQALRSLVESSHFATAPALAAVA